MKVYVVLKLYNDPEGNECSYVECIFSTKELAQDFVNHDIGDYAIEEYKVNTEDLSSTKYTKERIKAGKIEIKNKTMIFK